METLTTQPCNVAWCLILVPHRGMLSTFTCTPNERKSGHSSYRAKADMQPLHLLLPMVHTATVTIGPSTTCLPISICPSSTGITNPPKTGHDKSKRHCLFYLDAFATEPLPFLPLPAGPSPSDSRGTTTSFQRPFSRSSPSR
jgi:hypothetical protein